MNPIRLKVYGGTFKFELPEAISRDFMAGIPPQWVDPAPGKEADYESIVTHSSGLFQLVVNRASPFTTPAAPAMIARLEEIIKGALLLKDQGRGYILGGAVAVARRVCVILGSPGGGMTTLIDGLAREGAEVLGDVVIVATSKAGILPLPGHLAVPTGGDAPPRVVPYGQARLHRPRSVDVVLLADYLENSDLRVSDMSPGTVAAALVRKSAPNIKFLPVYAEMGRSCVGYRVIRGDIESTVAPLMSLIANVAPVKKEK